MRRALMLGALLWPLVSVDPLRGQASDGAFSVVPDMSATVPLTLDEARRLALRRNPDYLAVTQRLAEAEADRVTASTYPWNPELGVEGPGAFSTGSIGRYEARLSQEIEWAGQTGLRSRAAEYGSAAAGGEVRDATRRLLLAMEVAYAELVAARNRREVAKEIRVLNERLQNAVRIQLDEGEVSLLQANLVEIESGRGRARELEEEQAVRTAEIELAALLGLAPDTPIEPAEDGDVVPPAADALVEEALMAMALERRPDVEAALASVERSRTLDRLANREALPSLRVQGIAERDAPGAELRWGVGLSLGIPIFDRNRGLRLRRDAELRAANLRHEGALLRVRADVRDALQTYRAASLELETYESSVLEPTGRSQPLLEAAYTAGKLNLEALLLLRNQLLDAELGSWAAWARHRRAWATLRAATAANLDDITPISNEEGLR